MFAKYPLDFEFYGNDIRYAKTDEIEDLVDELSREAFAEELKMSCTNVMLQCLDAQSRCIFILGTMFRIDSRTGAEILNMTPENYRQKLSRARKKMADSWQNIAALPELATAAATGGWIMQSRSAVSIRPN